MQLKEHRADINQASQRLASGRIEKGREPMRRNLKQTLAVSRKRRSTRVQVALRSTPCVYSLDRSACSIVEVEAPVCCARRQSNRTWLAVRGENPHPHSEEVARSAWNPWEYLFMKACPMRKRNCVNSTSLGRPIVRFAKVVSPPSRRTASQSQARSTTAVP